MNEVVLRFLGPYTSLVLGLTFAAVLYWRKSIRKRHIVRLLALSVLTLVAFFAVLLWSFTWYKGQNTLVLVHTVLTLLAAIFLSSSSAVGFSFMLKHVGLAPLEDAGTRKPPRRVE